MRGNAALLVALLLAPALAGCAVLDRPKGWDLTLPIGVFASPRGGSVLEEVTASVELAARQWNDLGVGIEFRVLTDPATDSPTAAYDRLVAKKVAAVIAAVSPAEAASLVQRAGQKNVPLFLATPPATPLNGGTNVLQLAAPPGPEAEALADLATARGASRIALLSTGDIYTNASVAAFLASYEGEVVSQTVLPRDSHALTTGAARDVCASGARAMVLFMPAREAGWAVRGLLDGACRDRVAVYAASGARHPELVDEAGRDGLGRPHAAGVEGVELATSRAGEYRALFLTETGRTPGLFSAEAYDAVSIATLASFTSKGSVRADPVRATIAPADVRAHMLDVAEPPGIKHRERPAAAEAAKRADPIDWVGYAHDLDYSDARAPTGATYTRWTVTETGAIERV